MRMHTGSCIQGHAAPNLLAPEPDQDKEARQPPQSAPVHATVLAQMFIRDIIGLPLLLLLLAQAYSLASRYWNAYGFVFVLRRRFQRQPPYMPADTESISLTVYRQLRVASYFSLMAYCMSALYEDDPLPDSLGPHYTKAWEGELVDWEAVHVIKPQDKDQSGYCLIALNHTHKQVVLSFRGTRSVTDALTDLNIERVSWTSCINKDNIIDDGELLPSDERNEKHTDLKDIPRLVHKGFFSVAQRVMNLEITIPEGQHAGHYTSPGLPNLTRSLLEEYKGYQLFITGHLMGGALAAIAGVDFMINTAFDYRPVVITVAAPRVFSDKFADQLTNYLEVPRTLNSLRRDLDGMLPEEHGAGVFGIPGMYRIFHNGDVVPTIPSGTDWKHVGVSFYISKAKLPHLVCDVKLCLNEAEADGNPNVTTGGSVDRVPDDAFPISAYAIPQHLDYFMDTSQCQHGYKPPIWRFLSLGTPRYGTFAQLRVTEQEIERALQR